MPIPVRFRAPFLVDQFYHLIFLSIDGLLLFRTTQHRKVFIKNCHLFLQPFATFWAYSFLPNQAHFVIKCKGENEIKEELSWVPYRDRTRSMLSFIKEPSSELFNAMMERQVNRMLVSYVNSYNYMEERKGGLFQKPFRRIWLSDMEALKETVLFVHTCAQKEGVVLDYRAHQYHSHDEIVRKSSVLVDTQSVMLLFESPEIYRSAHLKYADQNMNRLS
jgi:hypothetical protein